MSIDLVVSIYQHLCMGKKGTETGNCKINRNQEMLNIDNVVLSKGKGKLSMQCADILRLPEQLLLEI